MEVPMNPLSPDESLLIVTVIALVCAALAGGVGFLLARLAHVRWATDPGPLLAASIIPAFITGYVAFIVVAVNALDSIPAQTAFHTPQGTVVAVFHERTNLWKRGPFRDPLLTMEGEFLPFKRVEYTVAMLVTPITENPKVRELRYSVSFSACGTGPEECWNTRKAAEIVHGEPSFGNLVRYHLFEMQDELSRVLATLSNPLDADQQARFLKIVHGYLEEKLPGDIKVTSATFSFPEA